MTHTTEPTIDEIDKIFDTVLDDKKCIADHNDFGGDVIITFTGVWCENCEKPIGDVLPLRDLLSDKKIAQIKALISDQVAKARIGENTRHKNTLALYTAKHDQDFVSKASSIIDDRIATLNGVKNK